MKTWVYMALGAVLATAGSSVGADGFGGGYLAGGQNPPGAGATPPPSFTFTPAYGLDGGYDWRLGGTFMLGVEGHLGNGTVDDPDGGYGLGLKIGVPLDSLMPYAHFGYEHPRGTSVLPGIGNTGKNGGLGLIYKFAPHWRMEGEWSTASPSVNGFKFNSNSLNFGVNYQFGSTGAGPSERP